MIAEILPRSYSEKARTGTVSAHIWRRCYNLP
jgi:hypothetical protein